MLKVGARVPGVTPKLSNELFPAKPALTRRTTYVLELVPVSETTILTIVVDPGGSRVMARLVVAWPLILTLSPATAG